MDHEQITVETFRGMFDRGVADDATPRDFFVDAFNTKYQDNDALTRDGSTLVITASSIVRFFAYKRLGEATRVIWLNTSGQLIDSSAPGVPIWTDASFTDFSMVNFNNRAYITPHNRTTGISGKYVLVYEGSGVARLAAGAAPTGFTLGAVESASSGNCEEGTHIIAVAFESSTGFITAPGPTLFGVVESTGGKAIDLSAVPALPAGMVAVRVLSTKAIQDYNGNQEGYVFYLVPSANGGRITGGASTGSISFFDGELLTDATYLFNNRALISAGVGICEYASRMLVWGINGDEHTVYCSKPGDPEQFDVLAGFIVVNPFDNSSGVKNIVDFRGNLLICKSYRSYVSTDNGSDPSTWDCIPIDNSGGSECFGIGNILDSKGQQVDRSFIASRAGLLVYEGTFRKPEATWLVDNVWKRITASAFNLIQVCIDSLNQAIYITLPLDASTSINYILYGYYGLAYDENGLNLKAIRWALWQFQPGTKSIIVDVNSSQEVVLKYAGTSGNIYDMKNDYAVHADDGNAYQSYAQLSLMSLMPKWIHHLQRINLRIHGSGTLLTTVSGLDGVGSTSLPNLTMSAAPGREYELKANFKNEKVSIKLRTGASVNEYFKLSRIDIFLKPLWKSRAA